MDYRFKPSARGGQVAVVSLLFIVLTLLPLVLFVALPDNPSVKKYSAIELSSPRSDWKIPIQNGDDSDIVCENLLQDPSVLQWDCEGTIVTSKIVESTAAMETITRRMLRSATFSNAALDSEVIEKNNVFYSGISNALLDASVITMQGSGDHDQEVIVALVQGDNYEVMADLIWKRLSKSGELPLFVPNPSEDLETPLPPHLPTMPEGFGDAA